MKEMLIEEARFSLRSMPLLLGLNLSICNQVAFDSCAKCAHSELKLEQSLIC